MSKNRRLHLRLAGAEAPTHRHDKNPFADWTPELTTKHKRLDLGIGGKMLFDKDGNEAEGKILIPYKRDAGRFLKLFWDALDELPELSHTALSVLFCLMKQALADNHVVEMQMEVAVQFCGFTQPKSFYEGVNELIIYQYIARTRKTGFYYLNPQIFFSGNRKSKKEAFIGPKHQYKTQIDQ